MPQLDAWNMIGGLIFGSIGFVAFVFGKRMHAWTPMFIGLALMAFPYFVANAAALYVIGVALSSSLFLFRG